MVTAFPVRLISSFPIMNQRQLLEAEAISALLALSFALSSALHYICCNKHLLADIKIYEGEKQADAETSD